MKELLNKIFFESGFKVAAETTNTIFFENPNDGRQSYYLVHFIGVQVLKGYLDSIPFEEAYMLFEEQKKLKPDIEKNTSLLIIAVTENIEQDLNTYKNSILQIEEDEFWFKKYVLVYSNESIANFNESDMIVEDLNTCILNNSQFIAFKDALYVNKEYFVVMQIFLKIPFLIVPISLNEQYLSINSILQNNLSSDQLSLLNMLLTQSEEITDEYWDSLKDAGNKVADSEQLSNFFSKFKAND
jgi:hypothetical protein